MTSPLRRAALLGTALSLLLAGPALAADYTVDPDADSNGACGGGDSVCSTIGQAIDAAAGADTITIARGDFAERPTVPSGKDGLTIKGSGPETRITGNVGTGDIFTIESAGVKVSTLAVTGAADSGSSIAIPGSATLFGVVVTRGEGTDAPAVLLSGAASTIRSSVIFNQAQGPAVRSEAPGLELVDSVLLSTSSHGLHLTSGEANEMVRSSAISSAAGAAGVFVDSQSNDDTAKKLVMRSAVAVGPADGLRAASESGLPTSSAGPITLDVSHSTLLGANGLFADAQANGSALDGAAGAISAAVDNSIVHGAVRAEKAEAGLLTAANTATVTLARSDVPASSTGDGTVNRGADCMFNEDAKLFAPGRVNLRTDAPVIDKGTAPAAGNDRDFESQPRVSGAASDIGADEFVNRGPAAAIKVSTTSTPAAVPITFDGSDSKDPEEGAGGSISEYRWDFGDGVKQTTQTPTVEHAYASPGDYNATLTVVDNFGVESAPATPVRVSVGSAADTAAPVVQILQPQNGQRLKLRGKKRRGKRRPIQLTILGGVTDATGIKQVDVALRLVKRKRGKRVRGGRCEYYNGRRRFRKPDCDEPLWLKVSRTRNVWRFRSRKGYRLPPGRYQLRARGTDIVGNVSSVFTKDAKTLVTFRVR